MSAVFEGIRVLDLTNNYAGPTGAAILADYGAEVIHIERPVFGDDTHSFGPMFNGEGWQYQWPNRGKKSVVIDLNDPEGVELVKKMAATADVLIESYRPGVMKRFGLDYEVISQIKPDVIYCSVSAFGQTGPHSKKAGYDLLAQGMSGIMAMTGEADMAPQKSGVILGDIVGGLNAYMSVVTALYHRLRTGEGQHIDVSLYEGLVSINAAADAHNFKGKPTRAGNHHAVLCPYGVFNGREGQSMIICAPNNKLWERLCGLMHHEELVTDPEFNTSPARIKNLPETIAFIENYLKTFENIDDAVKIIDEAGIPCCKIVEAYDVEKDPHLIERGSVVTIKPNQKLIDAGLETITVRGPWNKFSKTPGVMKQPPVLGQHNHEILEQCGMTAEEVDALQQKWTDKYTAKK